MMRKILWKTLFLSFITIGMSAILTGAEAWNTDFKKARQEGRARKMPLLMVFSGSDWCRPCIHLERNVLNKRSFIAEASRKYILFKADFPRGRTLGQQLESQNKSLAGRYSVYSYPTVIVLDAASGRVLARETGFPPGIGPQKFLEYFNAKTEKAGKSAQPGQRKTERRGGDDGNPKSNGTDR